MLHTAHNVKTFLRTDKHEVIELGAVLDVERTLHAEKLKALEVFDFLQRVGVEILKDDTVSRLEGDVGWVLRRAKSDIPIAVVMENYGKTSQMIRGITREQAIAA